MALVLFSHANPHADNRNAETRNFRFRIDVGGPDASRRRAEKTTRNVIVRVEQRPTEEINRSQGTGFLVWDASYCLGLYFLDSWNAWFPSGSARVIELGSGTGLGAIGAWLASRGRASVIATDLEDCVPLLKSNLDGNVDRLTAELGFESVCPIRSEALNWWAPRSSP